MSANYVAQVRAMLPPSIRFLPKADVEELVSNVAKALARERLRDTEYHPRPFRYHDVYEVECVCGQLIQTEDKNNGFCKECKRGGEMHWGEYR